MDTIRNSFAPTARAIRLALTIALALCALPALAQDPEPPFDFVVIGCMPYHFPADHERFLQLIDEVNALRPAFTVHCGDTKAGQTPCDDRALDQVLGYFNAFNHPLAYSIGDNEWTDCHRENAGGYDPIERLAYIRSRFFTKDETLGARPMPVVSQRADPVHGLHVENTRWERGGILFTAVHVVGSNNNLRPEDPHAVDEFNARDAANEAWLRNAFDHAKAHGLAAIAVFIQANPFDSRGDPRDTGFVRFVRVLKKETKAFNGQVVLFHADSHYFRIDKPLRRGDSPSVLENFTRVETFGSHNMHAVRVTVDPSNPTSPFTFRAHLIGHE